MRLIWRIAVTLMAVAYWLLLATGYPGHLHAAEGDQMFLCTIEYASESILCPGGLAGYIGSFIVQFFYQPWAGAALVAFLLVTLAESLSRLCKNERLLPLTLVPSVVYAVLLMDPKWSVAGLVGLTAATGVAADILKIRRVWLRIVVAVILLPFVYQFFLAAKFYTYAKAPVAIWWSIVAGTALISLICAVVPERIVKHRLLACVFSSFVSIAILAVGTLEVSRHYDAVEEEIDCYTYLVRKGDWDGIIKKAQKEELRSPVSTSSVNLALEMKGLLSEKMFNYYQSGPRSLINFEERKVSTEILFHLGFVNEATHLAFEDMAGNPSRKRGVYHITRLARFTAVDSTNAKLTERYLATLDKTLFYRHFDVSSSVTPQMEPSDDFFFDYTNFQNMLYLLRLQRPDNVRAKDYLAASILLDKNPRAFASLFGGEENPPLSHRQALEIVSALDGAEPSLQMKEYVNDYNASRGNASGMSQWKGTYWYYYNFQ